MEILIGIVCFLIGWVAANILRRLGGIVVNYDITHGQALIDLHIKFRRRIWKELLTVLLPPRVERFKAEIRYLYEGGDTWPIEVIWKEVNSPYLVVDDTMEATIDVWKYINGVMSTLNDRPLPNRFTLDIRIKRVSDNTVREHFEIPLEIN